LAANRFGLVLSEITPEQRKELRISSGVLVEEVRSNGARSDLRAGDIILAVIVKGVTNEIKSVEQFNKLASQFEKGSNVTLLIRRGDNQSFITLKGVEKQG
jgi:serine protease Do